MDFDRFVNQFKLTPMQAVIFGNFVFSMADRMVEGYTGGNWECEKVSDAIVLVIPGTEPRVTLNSEFNSADFDRKTAGATFTFFVLSAYWNTYSDKLSDASNEAFEKAYFAVRDAGYTDGNGIDSGAFYRFTD